MVLDPSAYGDKVRAVPPPETQNRQCHGIHIAIQLRMDEYAGERLAASYVNFYLANGAVILPGYGVAEDEAAVRLFEV